MIEAEKLLFKAALEDTNNQIFILLSDRFLSPVQMLKSDSLYIWWRTLIVSEVPFLCSCVPLYNFSYIYKYIMSSPRSFVDRYLLFTLASFDFIWLFDQLKLSILLFLFSFIDDATEKRYNPEMSPDIPEDKWRKGSQVIFVILTFS